MALQLLFILISSIYCCIGGDVNIDVPKGHLQPLGSHREPDSVPEFNVDSFPTPEEFWKKFVKPSKPAVFRGAAKSFGGYAKWTDEYLTKNYGDLELRLEGNKEKFGRTPYGILGVGRDTMENFVSHYHDPGYKGYIVTELPVPMYPEAGVLPFMTCGTFKHRMVEVDLWMNGGNASSVLHKDAFNTMNCLINGTKDWKLIALSEEKNIYKAWEAAPAHGGYSKINVKSVDLKKYPKVSNVPWQYTKIEKGDCLFLPKGMYHNVLSYGTNNLAVALLFSRFDQYRRRNLDFSDCDNVTKTTAPLSEFIVDWMYEGKADLSMGNSDLEDVRMNMLENVNRAGKFTLKKLTKRIQSIYSEKDEQFCKDHATKAYDYLTGGSGEITREIIKKFTKKQLRVAAMCFERVHPTNANWNEYNALSPDAIEEGMERLIKKNPKVISRKQFLKIYVGGLEGSPVFGNRFFDIVAGKGVDSVSLKQFKEKLSEAVQPYAEHQIEGEEAASPEVFSKSKPEGYEDGDVDEIAEKERGERKKRFLETEEDGGEGDGEEEEGDSPDEGADGEEEGDDDKPAPEVMAGEDEDGKIRDEL